MRGRGGGLVKKHGPKITMSKIIEFVNKQVLYTNTLALIQQQYSVHNKIFFKSSYNLRWHIQCINTNSKDDSVYIFQTETDIKFCYHEHDLLKRRKVW